MLRLSRDFVATFGAFLLMHCSASFPAEDSPHWSYTDPTGPAKWDALESEYSACALGKTQSPIDIHDDVVKKSDLPAINFDYKASTLRIIDNGHTIQINYSPGS